MNFLAQRESERRRSMGPVDTKHAELEERQFVRALPTEVQKTREAERVMQANAATEFSSSSSSEPVTDSADNKIYNKAKKHKHKCQRPVSIVTPEVAAALDRTRVSERNATYLLAVAAAQSLGHDPVNII